MNGASASACAATEMLCLIYNLPLFLWTLYVQILSEVRICSRHPDG